MNTSDPKKERSWAILCHLMALLLLLQIPFGNILGPLAVWLIKRDQMPIVDSEGKESINFQISMTIYCAIATFLSTFIGNILMFPLAAINIIFIVFASFKTSKGEKFQYPLTIRLIR